MSFGVQVVRGAGLLLQMSGTTGGALQCWILVKSLEGCYTISRVHGLFGFGLAWLLSGASRKGSQISRWAGILVYNPHVQSTVHLWAITETQT